MGMIGATMDAKSYLSLVQREIDKLDVNEIQAMADAIYQRYLSNRFVYIIGNGGSGANASHLCEDLGKSTVLDFENQKRLKVLSLTDNTPYILAWANDTSYDRSLSNSSKTSAKRGICSSPSADQAIARMFSRRSSGPTPTVSKPSASPDSEGVNSEHWPIKRFIAPSMTWESSKACIRYSSTTSSTTCTARSTARRSNGRVSSGRKEARPCIWGLRLAAPSCRRVSEPGRAPSSLWNGPPPTPTEGERPSVSKSFLSAEPSSIEPGTSDPILTSSASGSAARFNRPPEGLSCRIRSMVGKTSPDRLAASGTRCPRDPR